MTTMGYWTVDLPGLDREGAEQVLGWAKSRRLGEGGSLVDPAAFLTLHLDRDTVETLVAALSASAAETGGPEQGDVGRVIAGGILEVFRDWLREA